MDIPPKLTPEELVELLTEEINRRTKEKEEKAEKKSKEEPEILPENVVSLDDYRKRTT